MAGDDDSFIITTVQLGKISSGDLSLLLVLYPKLMGEELAEARELLSEKEATLLSDKTAKAVWCHLYELPAKEHFAKVLVGLGGEDVLREIAKAPNQIQALPGAVDKALADIDAWEPDEQEAKELQNVLGVIFGLSVSVLNSARSLMVFGHYLNDLIAVVRAGGDDADKALFSAIKIDPTVLGCPSVVARVSRAVMLDDKLFLSKMQKAIGAPLTIREQKNYQKMRLVLEILYETGAPQLSTNDLYLLFHKQLQLVKADSGKGDVRNNLRQFAYQFMKDRPVSQNV